MKTMHIGSAVLLTLLLAGANCQGFGCSGGSSTNGGGVGLDYTEPSVRAWVSVPIFPDEPIPVNFIPSHYEVSEVSPDLPDGLVLDEQTGILSGTPTIALEEVQLYQVRGSIPAVGTEDTIQAFASISIRVFPPVPPSGLSYREDPMRFPLNASGPVVVPELTGAIETISAAPPLPDGLLFSVLDGSIRGLASGPLGTTEHVVTVTNPFGSVETTVHIEVYAPLLTTSVLTLHAYMETALVSSGPTRPAVEQGMIDSAASLGIPLSAVASSDGRFVFVAHADSRIRRHAVDPASGRLADAEEALQLADVKFLAFDGRRNRLVAAGSGYVAAFDVGADGALSSPALCVGPSLPSGLAVDQPGNRALVASSGPLAVQAVELESFTPFGPSVTLEPDFYVTDLKPRALGNHFFVAGFHYDGGPAQGGVRLLVLATPESVALGHPPVSIEAQHDLQGMPDGIADFGYSGDETAYVVEPDAHLIEAFRRSGNSLEPSGSWSVAYTPQRCLAVEGSLSEDPQLYVMEGTGEIHTFVLTTSGGLVPAQHYRTRNAAIDILGHPGRAEPPSRGTALAACGSDSSLRVFGFDDGDLGAWQSVGKPQAVGEQPTDVERHPDGNSVYTANHAGGSISEFGFNGQERSLTFLAELALAPGMHPRELCLDPAGRYVYASVDRDGSATCEIATFEVSPSDGMLSYVNSISTGGAGPSEDLAVDATGTFLFIALPAAQRVRVFQLPNSGGTPQPGPELVVSDPAWLMPLPNGRQLAILDGQSAQLATYTVAAEDGSLSLSSMVDALGSSARRAAYDPWGRVVVADLGLQELHWFLQDPETNVLSALPLAPSPVSGLELRARSYSLRLGSQPYLLLLEDDGLEGTLRCYAPGPFAPGTGTGLLAEFSVGQGPLSLQFSFER